MVEFRARVRVRGSSDRLYEDLKAGWQHNPSRSLILCQVKVAPNIVGPDWANCHLAAHIMVGTSDGMVGGVAKHWRSDQVCLVDSIPRMYRHG